LDEDADPEDAPTRELVVSWIKFLSMARGLPTGQPLMTAESIVDWNEGEIESGRDFVQRQVHSKWTMEEQRKEDAPVTTGGF